MTAALTDPPAAIAAPAPVLLRVRAAAAKVAARRGPARRHGPIGLFLTTVAVIVTGYTGWWALCLLHGHARVLVAGAVSTGYLLGAALWRRGWLG